VGEEDFKLLLVAERQNPGANLSRAGH
jgi:hypothetical protein